MAERDARSSPLTALGDGILLLCATAGFALSFLSLYGGEPLRQFVDLDPTPLDLCAGQAGGFLFLAVLFALISLGAWSLPRYRGLAAGGLAALWGLLAFLNWDSVVQGGAVTVRTVADLFAQRVSWGRAFPYESGLTLAKEGNAAGLFFTLFLALLALALGWAVVRARRWWIVLLLTLPPLLPGLLADLYPGWPPFMALALCWCAMLLCDLCKWAAPDRRGLLTLAVLPCVAVVLTAVTLLFPREGYTRPAWALRAETELNGVGNRLSDFFTLFDGPLQSTVTYVGAAEEADLAGAGPLRYSGRTVLRVTTDYHGRLYLRGSSLAVYEDGRWSALPAGTWQEYQNALPDPDDSVFPLIFPSLTLPHGGEYTATVDNVGAVGACVYAPYYLADQDWEAAGMLPVEDAYLARLRGQWTHTMTFTDLHPFGASITEFINELSPLGIIFYAPPEADAYREEYVLAHYLLDVESELGQYLARLCVESGASSAARYGEGYDPVQAAYDIAALLDELCEYDPETPAAPDGIDPVVWFLSEGRRGYCMHFASAATLMLRSLGVPARYVSGFTAECVPGKQADVPDRAAHAWVEVWVSGFGWYPVEVTPAAAFTWYEQGVVDPVEASSEPLPESEAPEPAPTPTPAPSQGPEATQQPTGGPQGEDGDTPPTEGGGPAFTIPVELLKGLAAAVGVFVLLWLVQYLPKRFREKKLSDPDRNRAALYGYRCLRRMERWGGRVSERAVELAQKAKFSQHTLTPEELAELRGFVDGERERLCIVLEPVERLVFRLLWGMPQRSRPGEGEPPPENPE